MSPRDLKGSQTVLHPFSSVLIFIPLHHFIPHITWILLCQGTKDGQASQEPGARSIGSLVPTRDLHGSPCHLPSLCLHTAFLCLGVLRKDHFTAAWFSSLACKWSSEMETSSSGSVTSSWECESDRCPSTPSLEPGDDHMGSTGYECRLPFLRVGVFKMLPDKNPGSAFRFSACDLCIPLLSLLSNVFKWTLFFSSVQRTDCRLHGLFVRS